MCIRDRLRVERREPGSFSKCSQRELKPDMSANRATPHKGTFDGTVKSDAQMWSRTRAGTVDRKVAARTSLAETDMQARAQVVVQRCTPGRQYLYHEQHCTKPYCEVYPV